MRRAPGAAWRICRWRRCAVVERAGEFYLLRFSGACRALEVLEQFGAMPLPPYIERPSDAEDEERYQTVYARAPGAVAAPTAGLHFDQAMLDALQRAASAAGLRHAARRRRHVPAGAQPRHRRPSDAPRMV